MRNERRRGRGWGHLLSNRLDDHQVWGPSRGLVYILYQNRPLGMKRRYTGDHGSRRRKGLRSEISACQGFCSNLDRAIFLRCDIEPSQQKTHRLGGSCSSCARELVHTAASLPDRAGWKPAFKSFLAIFRMD